MVNLKPDTWISLGSMIVALGAVVATFVGIHHTNKTNERNQRRINRANRQMQADRLAAEATARSRAERIRAGEELFTILDSLVSKMNAECLTPDNVGIWRFKMPDNVDAYLTMLNRISYLVDVYFPTLDEQERALATVLTEISFSIDDPPVEAQVKEYVARRVVKVASYLMDDLTKCLQQIVRT